MGAPLGEKVSKPGRVLSDPQQAGNLERSLTESTAILGYSVYEPWKKWLIVALTSLAAMFSPLSSNVYFPAIPVIATAFSTSIERINITVTVYMLLQGLSPAVWSGLADSRLCGRRPVYLACLALLALSCVGLAFTPVDAYWLLVLLRCFQAAGCASVIAISSGTIMDIAAPGERGIFLGVSSLGAMFGSCIGPVIGGVLAGRYGWRAIFYFLLAASALCFLLELLFLPETLRAIVGDGSLPAPRWNRPLLPVLGQAWREGMHDGKSSELPRRTGPLDFVKLFTHIDVCLILWTNAVSFTMFYCIQTTLSPLFLAAYPSLTETEIGLCYLASGAGCIVGAPLSGRLLDISWAREEARVKREGGHVRKEHARLSSSPIYWGLNTAVLAAYGWCVRFGVSVGVTLLLQFFATCMTMCIFTVSQTLLMDLFPGRGSAVGAANNIVRCLLGAVVISVIDFVRLAIGPGWTFTALSVWCVLTYPLVLLEWRYGTHWAAKRKST
ncbi:MFS general substrate transporter [Dacryopinax primogenitus]|uniref:MFS general substrate transporter n=1 Tax=Dacryopinax primogenitus (strain DJM 731) TaxID=1858805 RepID=M5FTM5_DACPD|nr:MFS general substrate transporter [Dacryopinax primogenitus]EJT98759.1 MFS general substrate transporter [Dacryopinax primogenitus]